MKRFFTAILIATVGYLITASLSYVLIGTFSSNGHDSSVEASMTSIFVYGPIGFLIAFIIGYVCAKKKF